MTVLSPSAAGAGPRGRSAPRPGVALFALAAALLPGSAQAAQPALALAPSSPWRIDYADDSCRLARTFGEGKQQTILVMDRFEPDEGFLMTIAGEPVRKALGSREAIIRFLPDEQEQSVGYFPGGFDGSPAMLFTRETRIAAETEQAKAEREAYSKAHNGAPYEAPPIGRAREAAVTGLLVKPADMRPILLQTGAMADPMSALRKCTNELLSHWGTGLVAHQALGRPPIPTKTPGRWLSNTDYPLEAIQKGYQALVHVRLDVDATGAPTGCHVQQATNPKGFGEIVCRALLARSRFLPALDADGRPTASYYVTSVQFKTPD